MKHWINTVNRCLGALKNPHYGNVKKGIRVTLKTFQVKYFQVFMNGTSPGRKMYMFKGVKAEEEPFMCPE